MNGRACSLVRARAIRVYTVPVRGPGMAVCFCAVLCGCVLPTGAGCTVIIYTEACALHFPRVYVRYGFWLGQPKQCILYVYACVYGGRPSVSLVVNTCMRGLYSI